MDALPKDVKSPEATIPSEAIHRINKLFEIEQRLDILSPDVKQHFTAKHNINLLLSSLT